MVFFKWRGFSELLKLPQRFICSKRVNNPVDLAVQEIFKQFLLDRGLLDQDALATLCCHQRQIRAVNSQEIKTIWVSNILLGKGMETEAFLAIEEEALQKAKDQGQQRFVYRAFLPGLQEKAPSI